MTSPSNTDRRTWLLPGVALSLIGLIFLGSLGLRMKNGPDARSENTRSQNAATTLSVVKAAAPSASQADSTATDKVPKGLTASDWSGIKREYERHRHAAFPVGGPGKGGGAPAWQAHNHSQQWLTRFDGRGFAVEPDGAGWRWGLELQSYGFSGRQRAVSGQAQVSVETERVAYDWDGTIEEWFVNDRRGLEHGFTLRERPGGGRARVKGWNCGWRCAAGCVRWRRRMGAV